MAFSARLAMLAAGACSGKACPRLEPGVESGSPKRTCANGGIYDAQRENRAPNCIWQKLEHPGMMWTSETARCKRQAQKRHKRLLFFLK
jgi:hypothetical protein